MNGRYKQMTSKNKLVFKTIAMPLFAVWISSLPFKKKSDGYVTINYYIMRST